METNKEIIEKIKELNVEAGKLNMKIANELNNYLQTEDESSLVTYTLDSQELTKVNDQIEEFKKELEEDKKEETPNT